MKLSDYEESNLRSMLGETKWIKFDSVCGSNTVQRFKTGVVNKELVRLLEFTHPKLHITKTVKDTMELTTQESEDFVEQLPTTAWKGVGGVFRGYVLLNIKNKKIKIDGDLNWFVCSGAMVTIPNQITNSGTVRYLRDSIIMQLSNKHINVITIESGLISTYALPHFLKDCETFIHRGRSVWWFSPSDDNSLSLHTVEETQGNECFISTMTYSKIQFSEGGKYEVGYDIVLACDGKVIHAGKEDMSDVLLTKVMLEVV